MSLTSSKEDVLTELFVEAINSSSEFREKLSALFELNEQIVKSTSQVQFPGTNCVPDVVVETENGKFIVIENKIDASETKGSESDSRNQLQRYLDLPVSFVIYIRRGVKAVDSEVLNNDKYLRPKNNPHYIWNDIYKCLLGNNDAIVRLLMEGLSAMGLSNSPVLAIGNTDEKYEKLGKNIYNHYAIGRSGIKAEWTKNKEIYLNMENVGYIFIPFKNINDRFMKVVIKSLNEKSVIPISDSQLEGVDTENINQISKVYIELIDEQIQIANNRCS